MNYMRMIAQGYILQGHSQQTVEVANDLGYLRITIGFYHYMAVA
jgi:hypothetical protein